MRMNTILYSLCLILLTVSLFAVNPRDMKFDALNFKPEEPVRFTTDNGMIVYFYEDHQLPVMSATAYFNGGSVHDPDNKIGLSAITAAVMRSGGAGKRSPDQVDSDLDYVAASVSIVASDEYFSGSVSSLIADIDLGFEIFSDILISPSFDPEKLNLELANTKERIRRRLDSPGDVTRWVYYRTVYQGHPYGSYPSLTTMDNITIDDVKNNHRRFFSPDNCIMAVSGDLTLEELKSKLRKYFSSWNKSGQKIPSAPHTSPEYRPGVYYAERDINQVHLRFGFQCLDSKNPDRYAMNIMNFALGGGGFISRMTNRVRTTAGLAYSVGTYFYNRPLGGNLFGYCQTKAENMSEAAQMMLDIIEEVKSGGITEEELNTARESIVNSFVFNYDTPDKVVSARALLELQGFPPDHLEKGLKAYQKVTLKDCNRVAKKYLNTDIMVFVITGNKEMFDRPPDTFGPVTEASLDLN